MRKRNNEIRGIDKGDKVWITNRKQMEQSFESYFSTMFKTTNPNCDFIDSALQDVLIKVMNQMNDQLLMSFARCDIEKVIKQMHPSKAPGPDGFSTMFYQKY